MYLLFRRFGTIISVHIMINKTTGLSKGYGFVSFAFHEDAKAAISSMDGFRVSNILCAMIRTSFFNRFHLFNPPFLSFLSLL